MEKTKVEHTIVHFEIPADDPENLSEFYRSLFGWDVEKAEGPTEYYLIKTGDSEYAVNGGMMRRRTPDQVPINYIAVESVVDYIDKAEKLGGRVLVQKEEVPDMGYFAILLDPQGNQLALWENKG